MSSETAKAKAAREKQEKLEAGPPKIAGVLYPSDDCAIMLGRTIDAGVITAPGEANYVHVGETVTMIPAASMREVIAIGQMARGSVELQSDELDASKVADLSGDASDKLCEALAKRITAWTWTDNFHRPLPQPFGNPEVLQDLTSDEIFYLIRVAQGEPESERKNGSRPSEATS